MRRLILLTATVFVFDGGCAGRVNTDLLQARIREQAVQLTEAQRDIERTRSELKLSKQEAQQLKAEIAQKSKKSLANDSKVPVTRVEISSLGSGGVNQDDRPGDDAVVVHFTPIDRDNESVKHAGDVDLVLMDPHLPETEREVGHWNFSSDECRKHWTHGAASTGFQFNLPLEESPRHADLLVRLKFKTADGRQLEANRLVKVAVAPGYSLKGNAKSRPRVAALDEDESLPPVGDDSTSDADLPDWAQDESDAQPGRAILHSANFTDATIPQYR